MSCWSSRSKTTQQSAHVVVLGNEKGGSGKSTTALHIAVALAQGRSARRHHRSRLAASRASRITSRTAAPGPSARASIWNMPTHYCVPRADDNSLDANEAQRVRQFSEAISAIEHSHDVVVIDTPGSDTYLMRLAHSMADTLITPLNDSFVDFDVLGTLDPDQFHRHRRKPLRRDGARVRAASAAWSTAG